MDFYKRNDSLLNRFSEISAMICSGSKEDFLQQNKNGCKIAHWANIL